MRRIFLSLGMALALGACDETMQSNSAGPQAGPGPGIVDGQTAGRLFGEVCIANLPNFAGAPATLASLPFRQNSATGTYYHNDLNLSFKLLEDEGEPACSVVYGGTEEAAVTVLAFGTAVNATANGQPADIEIDPFRGPDGLQYLHATATPQN